MVRKTFFWIFTTIVTLLLILLLLLQTRFFQNQIADWSIKEINSLTGHTTKFTNIEIKWFDYLKIKGLELSDYKGNRMIHASTLTVDYKLAELVVDGNLQFDAVTIEDGGLRVRKYDDTLNLNLIEYINVLRKLAGKPTDSLRKPPEIHFGKVWLDNFQFLYDNQARDSLTAGLFDYGHFLLEVPSASINDFIVYGDTIEASISNLSASDPASGLTVTRLQAQFRISNSGLDLDRMLLETPHSLVRESLHLQFSGMNDLNHFIDSVTFDANLIGSTIAKKDLTYFANIPIEDFSVRVTTRISGSVPRLSLEGLQLTLGNNTHLLGDIDFMGLPEIKETFIDARIKNTHVDPMDIKPYTKASSGNLEEIGDFEFSGRFLGFVNDFVANGDFYTSEGFVRSDINLKFPYGWEMASYSGNLILENFNVGALLRDTVNFQRINLKGKIDGKGLTRENAKFYLNADLRNSGFFGYTFSEISANGQFASEFFKGELIVNDTNCNIRTTGNVNLVSSPESINIVSDIQYLNLKAIGFTQDRLEIVSKINADITGLNLDSLQGVINIIDLGLAWREDSISMDSVKLSSFENHHRRKIAVRLPELEFDLEGDFLFSEVSKDLRRTVSHFTNYFEPDSSKRAVHVLQPSDYNRYTIDFTLKYDNINKYANFLDEGLYIAESGRVEGTYYQRENSTLSLFTELDSVNFRGVDYLNNTIDLNFSKDLDSLGIIASAFLNSERQIWKTIPPSQDLAVEAVWFNNKISLNLSVDQPGNNSSANVYGELNLLRDRLVFNFLPSNLIAFGERWVFNPKNRIEITNRQVLVDSLELRQNEQSILLTGAYSDSIQTDLQLKFTDLDLTILNAVTPTKLSGIMNSEVKIRREDLQLPFQIAGLLAVDSFRLNDFSVGNIRGKSVWEPDKKGLRIDLNMTRKAVKTIGINGHYYPGDEEARLDFKAIFNKASLNVLDPFFIGVFSDIQGEADGELTLTGTTKLPVLNGISTIKNGQLTTAYLGTTYRFDGQIGFDNEAIKFTGIRLSDKDGDRASLRGEIRHTGLKHFRADLRMAAGNFLFLNTSSIDNSLYYGTAKMTGDIAITGRFNDLLIKANGTTERGTKIFIPLSENEEAGQKDYISFVDFSDSTSYINLEEIVKNTASGIRLDFDLDVTPDAYVELIFNIRTGDIIRGRGNGNLNLSLDTNGEFELFGDISITEGAYNFTIPNFINKEFSVVPGSTISWYGDPYGGILDLEATYRQLADFNDLTGIEVLEGTSPRYPILVVLQLTGDMLSPVIDFEIKYDESQGSASMDHVFVLQQINNDEQELKRQVFSLLILRKFSQQSSFSVSGGAVESSLSEFLSNQFSYFISQVDENLEIDVDLASLDADAFNTFQLRLAYTFFDGRLRVSGGGAFPQNTPEQSTDYLGDWSVRYLLTPDGHLRVKAFSQSEQLAGAQIRETGVSFQYLKSFDDLKELLTKTREEAILTRPKDMSKEAAANENSGS